VIIEKNENTKKELLLLDEHRDSIPAVRRFGQYRSGSISTPSNTWSNL